MGGKARQLATLCSIHSAGARRVLPRDHHRQQHGLYGHHQVLQRYDQSPFSNYLTKYLLTYLNGAGSLTIS